MIARPVVLTLISNALGGVLGIVILNFASAYGGANPWGMWLYALTAAGLLYFLTGLGYPTAHVKHISAGLDEGKGNAVYLLVKLALTLLFVVLVLGAAFVWTEVFGRTLEDVTLDLIWLAVVFHTVNSLRQFFDYTFQARRLIVRAESVLLVDNIGSAIGVVVAAQMAARLQGSPVPMAAVADAGIRLTGIQGPLPGTSIALLLGAGYILGKLASLAYAAFQFFIHKHPIGRPDAETFREYHVYARPIAIVAFLAPMIAIADRFFVGLFGNAANVAEYFLAFSLIAPLPLLATAIGTLLFPTVSSLATETDRHRIPAILNDAERYLSMLLMPQVMLSIVFALEAVRVVTSGHRFDAAAMPLALLAGYGFFFSLVAPTRSLILGLGRSGLMARYGFLNAILIVGFNILLIPDDIRGIPLGGLGPAGASVATSLTALITYFTLRRHARMMVPVGWGPPEWRRQAAAALAAGALLWLARDRGHFAWVDRLGELVLVGLLGLLLYFLILALFRGITRQDLRRLWETIHPVRFASYVKDEMTPRGPSPKK